MIQKQKKNIFKDFFKDFSQKYFKNIHQKVVI